MCADYNVELTALHFVQYHNFRQKPHLCPHCPRRFRIKKYLQDHIKDVHMKRLEICQQCGKGFARRHTLLQHQKTHKGMLLTYFLLL